MAINELASEPAYMASLLDKVKNGRDVSNGTWSFFLGDNTPSDVATCYAAMSVYKRVPSEDLSKSRAYLWKTQLDLERPSKSGDISAIARRSLILYTLTKTSSDGRSSGPARREVTAQVKTLWHFCRSKYLSPSEFVVEYYRGDKNHYIRIPWQIYLAHALLCVDPSCFHTKIFHQYLTTLHTSALQGGYVFDYAGPYFSTRTNAILCSFLNDASIAKPEASIVVVVRDTIHEYWTKPWIRLTFVFLLSAFIAHISNVSKPIMDHQSSLSINLISGGITAFFAWLYGTGRQQ